MTEIALMCALSLLAAVGVYHLGGVWLRREQKNSVATYDKWILELHDAIHDLIDADIRVAQLEANVMDLVGKVPAETSYQAIRRLGLGRKVEAAILSKMEMLGIGGALPTEPTGEQIVAAVSPSRRAALSMKAVGE